jgi:hypothetical protein
MSPKEGLDLAIATLKDSDWNWHLRIGSIGVYRLYLSGRIAMNIKARHVRLPRVLLPAVRGAGQHTRSRSFGG